MNKLDSILCGILTLGLMLILMAYISSPDNSHLNAQEPDTRPKITGVCEECNLILPNAEVKRVRYCEGHYIAVADVHDDYMDVTIREGELDDPNRVIFEVVEYDVAGPEWAMYQNAVKSTITIEGLTLKQAFKHLFYYTAGNSDPNEYLMSAELVISNGTRR